MSKIAYEIKPRDLLFFRDARPIDADKSRKQNHDNVGHGANWPRPDHLFSAVIHELIHDPDRSEDDWYGSVDDLRVTGPFPFREGKPYLPTPLDWDMKLFRFDAEKGTTDIPAPLTCGFADRAIGKKAYPKWIGLEDYRRYLKGEVGEGKTDKEADEPANADGALMQTESRVGTTLDAETGASKRVQDRYQSGQYRAEYLRLGKGVGMLCEIETAKAGELEGADVRFGGQGGIVRFARSTRSLFDMLGALPKGAPSRFVRWTLAGPALFARGWLPNWIGEDGKVMLPAEKVLRQAGESRRAYRQRAHEAGSSFETAKLVAARVGEAVAFSGYDTRDAEKPTELAVPAGSAYVFECATPEEAAKLADVLNLKHLSDLGEKGFGFGLCSYVPEPKPFTVTNN